MGPSRGSGSTTPFPSCFTERGLHETKLVFPALLVISPLSPHPLGAFSMSEVDRRTAEGASNAIAIVGAACRYPDAASPQELWQNVLAQRQAFRRMPSERLPPEDYWSPDPSMPD